MRMAAPAAAALVCFVTMAAAGTLLFVRFVTSAGAASAACGIFLVCMPMAGANRFCFGGRAAAVTVFLFTTHSYSSDTWVNAMAKIA